MVSRSRALGLVFDHFLGEELAYSWIVTAGDREECQQYPAAQCADDNHDEGGGVAAGDVVAGAVAGPEPPVDHEVDREPDPVRKREGQEIRDPGAVS